ncbi:MAG TPA: hypothetical protein V6D47_00895 [Oscillatoriaceae cyanobacterium]
MRRHAGLALAGLLMLGACTAPASRLVLVPQGARLTLDLSRAFQRHALAVDIQPTKWQVRLDGPDLTQAQTQTTVAASGTSLVALTAVPVGDHRLVDLQALDASGTVVPGGELAVVGAIHTGSNSLSVSPETTATARVFAKILADDRTKSTSLASELNLGNLDTAVLGYARALQASDYRMLDATAIAQAIESSQGTLPSPQASFLDAPGQVLVQPSNFPLGAGYTVSIDDPSSWSVHAVGAAPALLQPVTPGTWTLKITPDSADIAPISQSITVSAGTTTKVPLSVATSKLDAALPFPLAPNLSGQVTIGGVQGTVALGGVSYDGSSPESATTLPGIFFENVLTYTADQGWKQGSVNLGQPIIEAASTFYNGKFYWFGGLDETFSLQSSAFAFDPSADATPEPLATIPESQALEGAAAAAIDNTIIVTGGCIEASGTANVTTYAYSPSQQGWTTTAISPVSPSRCDMASAMIGSTWYLFGGQALAPVYVNGATIPENLLQPQSAVSILSGGAWSAGAPMPTARSGAATLVLNGKIYVIGGAGEMGLPSTAVEVYDPAQDAWSVRPPLRVGRSRPIVFVQSGKIIVAGGLAGDQPTSNLALADVEELTP